MSRQDSELVRTDIVQLIRKKTGLGYAKASEILDRAIEPEVHRARLEELEACLRVYTKTQASGMQVRADLSDRISKLKEN